MNAWDRLLNSLANNWTLIASVVAAIAPLPAALHKFGVNLFNLRPNNIKEDLEILKMLDPADPNYKILKDYINESIAKRYQNANGAIGVYSWQAFLIGLGGSVFLTIWTIKLRAHGYNYWPWITAAGALLFFNLFASAFREKSAKTAKAKQVRLSPARD